MRILGIDYGHKKIGIALSDPTKTIAQGREVHEWKDKNRLIKHLKDIIYRYEVEKIVVGLPYNMDGTLGSKAKEVLTFIEDLKRKIEVPIVTWDERLTTLQAERILVKTDISRKGRRKATDKMAATLILQGFLDSSYSKSRRNCD